MKWLYETCSYLRPGGWFNIKMSSYLCRKSHCGDKSILRPSYLHNGISYTGKTTYLYWIGALSSFQHGQIHSSLRPGDAYMHIFSKLTNTDSGNSLLPGRCQAIIWTNAGILLIQTLGTNFSEILIKIHIFSFKKMHLKMLSVKCRHFVSASMC